MEQEDYSKIYEYESMGKVYADEKACISLTSWKARINTVAKTLYSLIKMCPGFHIVLVLSKDEFPLMEKELPDNLMLFVENDLIEILWVYKNYKTMKKVIFTMQKYNEVPIISADDDCIYNCNYAQELYDKWTENKNSIIIYKKSDWNGPQGPCTLYFPNFSKNIPISNVNFKKYLTNDDIFFKEIMNKYNIKIIGIKNYYPYTFHTKVGALNPGQY